MDLIEALDKVTSHRYYEDMIHKKGALKSECLICGALSSALADAGPVAIGSIYLQKRPRLTLLAPLLSRINAEPGSAPNPDLHRVTLAWTTDSTSCYQRCAICARSRKISQ